MLCVRTWSFLGRRLLKLPSAAVALENRGRGFNRIKDGQCRQFTRDLIDHPEGTVLKGEDFHGNKYYEAPRGESGSYLKTRRWMEPGKCADMDDKEFEKLHWKEQSKIIEARQDAAVLEVPPEWESWLRGRRTQTPSVQEQARSARVALRAKGLFPDKESVEASSSLSSATSTTVPLTGKSAEEVRKESVTGLSFPVYEDMEIQAGEELSAEERQRRIRYAKDKSGGTREDDDDHDDGAFVPPGARK